MTSTADAKLSRDVQRVHDLIRLACDSAASEAESRTAAWAAVRLIHLRGLLVLAVAPQPAPPRAPPPVDDGRYITAKFASCCRICGDIVHAGETCWWRRGGGVEHLPCHSQRGAT